MVSNFFCAAQLLLIRVCVRLFSLFFIIFFIAEEELVKKVISFFFGKIKIFAV